MDTQNQDHSSLQADFASSQESADQNNNSSPAEGSAPSVLDLDTVQKFKWAGREWTPKDLQGQVMMQADYTRKTQALAEERKFYDNLRDDLEAVKANPALAAEFKKIYPEKFHNYLGYVYKDTPQSGTEQKTPLPPEVQDLLKFKDEWQQERQNAFKAQIDAMEAKFTAKFELADVDRVLASAQQWRKDNPQAREIPEQVWEKLYKASHEANQGRFKKWSDAQVNKQKQANQEGADVPTGGGVPAQGPTQFRTIRDASKALRGSLANS